MLRSLRRKPEKGFYEELFDSGTDSDWSDGNAGSDEEPIVRWMSRFMTLQSVYGFVFTLLCMHILMNILDISCLIVLLCSTVAEAVVDREPEMWRIRGKDSWLGRSVKKEFGSAGTFTGRIDGVDDHAEKLGHRVFHITYSDGDDEWIEVDELIEILLPPGIDSVRYYLHD